MPAGKAILNIKILADARNAQAGLDKSASAAEKWQSRTNAAAVAVVAGFALLAKPAVDAASKQEQAFGGVTAVYGEYADTVIARSREAAQAVGLSAADYATAATSIGGNLKRMGIPMSDVANQSDELIARAADLAATYGGTTAEAVQALGAAFRGEADPAEKFNLNLKDSAVKAEIAAQAAQGMTFASEDQARASAITALILKDSADAAGQFGREMDSAAGAQQIATAAAEDAKAALGKALLPAVVKVSDALGGLAKTITANEGVTRKIVTAIAILGAAIVATNVATRIYTATTAAARTAMLIYRTVVLNVRVAIALLRSSTIAATIATKASRVATLAAAAAQKIARGAALAFAAAQRILNAAMRANPIGLIITLIFALGAALVMAYKKSETFRRIVNAAFAAVKAAISSLGGVVKSVGAWFASAFGKARDAINWLLRPIQNVIGWIERLISKISNIRFPKISVPSWVPGFGRSTVPATAQSFAASGRAVSPAASARRTPVRGVSVTVNGAANPQVLARDLARILNGANVRTGFRGVA